MVSILRCYSFIPSVGGGGASTGPKRGARHHDSHFERPGAPLWLPEDCVPSPTSPATRTRQYSRSSVIPRKQESAESSGCPRQEWRPCTIPLRTELPSMDEELPGSSPHQCHAERPRWPRCAPTRAGAGPSRCWSIFCPPNSNRP